MLNLVRWICFFLLKPLDYLAFLAALLYYPYFYFKVIPRGSAKKKPIFLDRATIVLNAKAEPVNQYGFVARDAHTLLVELGNGLINKERSHDLLSKVVTPSGSLLRRYPAHQPDPSSDCLASWACAYVLWGIEDKSLLRKVANSYLKHCFALRWDAKGGAAVRSTNSGVMPSYGAWPKKGKFWPFNWGLSQPMTGSSFYSTLGFLGLCRKELGGLWHLVYWGYYAICLGPIHRLTPMLYSKSNTIYYLHHILSINFWVLNKTVGGFKSQMRNVAITVSPNNARQPWICGFAADIGALTEEERALAMNTLLAIEGPVMWPQKDPSHEGFYKPEPKGWTNMYLALSLLSSKTGNKY